MTELIWDGKYDKATGKKVAPLRVALPFQTVETVNESAAERDRTLNLFAEGRDAEWRNRLIWGDKKYVLPSLLTEFAGKVDLVYIDPPFDTGANFSYMATVPDDPETEGDQSATFVKEPSVIEQKAYRDTWGKGLDSYLKWFYETVVILRDLLSENGSIYVHLDFHVAHYAKCVLDEVFGERCFQSEIIWKRTSARNDVSGWGSIHDNLFFYSKSGSFTWNRVFQTHDQEYLKTKYGNADANGQYRSGDLTAAGLRNGDSGKPWRGSDPSAIGRHWVVNREALETIVSVEQSAKMTTQDKLDLLDTKGYILWPTKSRSDGNGMPSFKRYLTEGVAVQDVIADIHPVNSQADERVGYSTQKPETLLERLIKASSNEGDLVLDCFCGSGTTAAVAEKLGRRWITCDLGRFAIHTARKRLLSIEGVKPFAVQNLGKYERQTWQADEFGGQAEARQQAYRAFILDLYRARPIEGRLWLHGLKNGRMVHVGSVDAPVSTGDIGQITKEFRKSVGTGVDAPSTLGVDILGWDFAFELNEAGKQAAANAGVQVRFVKIPREVLEKKAVEQGDIRFFELAALSVDAKQAGRSVTLTLTDFVIPPDDVPADIQRAITHWSQWIDYWAVDWDNKGDAFHNEWQTYRTKKNRDLQRVIAHRYDAPGEYRIVIKVIDILGNDTTKTLVVDVK